MEARTLEGPGLGVLCKKEAAEIGRASGCYIVLVEWAGGPACCRRLAGQVFACRPIPPEQEEKDTVNHMD